MNIKQYIIDNMAKCGETIYLALNKQLIEEKKRTRTAKKGVALLLVLSYVAIMSATVVSSFMNSQVSFAISTNIRDDLKAYYKARSAMNLGRLMLTYQYELEQDEFFGVRISRSNFQMYQILDLLMTPFKTGIVKVDVPGESTIASYDLKAAGVDAMGDETGDFNVKVFPEEGRININKFKTGSPGENIIDLCMLFASPQYDELFNTSGKDRDKLSRTELIAAIIDWVDADSDRTIITEDCVLEESSGDEASPYLRSRLNYEIKNDKFTTLDELHEVAGVGDNFMNTFKEALTVYPVEKVNANLANARVLYAALCKSAVPDQHLVSAANGKNVYACTDIKTGEALMMLALALEGYQQFVLNPLNLLYLYTVEGQLSVIPGVVPNGTVVPFRNTYEFTRVVEAMQKDPQLIKKFLMYSPTAYLMLAEQILTIVVEQFGVNVLKFDNDKIYNNITAESPRIFRIVATGEYDGTKKMISTVINFNTQGGQFLYWREY